VPDPAPVGQMTDRMTEIPFTRSKQGAGLVPVYDAENSEGSQSPREPGCLIRHLSVK